MKINVTYTAIYSPFEEMTLSEALEHVFLTFQVMISVLVSNYDFSGFPAPCFEGYQHPVVS